MTVLPGGARSRRGGRKPGWMLLTALLVLALLASSTLVFSDSVELLRLAVILSLWAAVLAAFVSVIYRRQSELDRARARDMKFVYDLQLDREIAARREYELNVESHLRRQLGRELRAETADEMAALRVELLALRANLEALLGADLGDRPALESERVRAMAMPAAPGRVHSSRVTEVVAEEVSVELSVRTETAQVAEVAEADSPIIDVAEEPLTPPPPPPASPPPSQSPPPPPPSPYPSPSPSPSPARPSSHPEPPPAPPQHPAAPPPRPAWPGPPPPVSPWPAAAASAEYRGSHRRPDQQIPVAPPASVSPGAPPVSPPPVPPPPPPPPSAPWRPAETASRRGRHRTPDSEPIQPSAPSAPSPQQQPAERAEPLSGRHWVDVPEEPGASEPVGRDAPADPEPGDPQGRHAGGQPAVDLMARLKANGQSGGGGRRRRKE